MRPPDPTDPDFQGHRFLAAAYRTSRALLQCRHLLASGQPLREILENGEVARAVPLDPSSTLRDAEEWVRDLPTVPPASALPQEQAERLSKAHLLTALKLGYEPDDPCLHWFEGAHFLDFFPQASHLVAFEDAFLPSVGRVLLRRGHERAMGRMERLLGPCSGVEKRDWIGLQRSYVKEFASTSTDEDRQMMIMRLENLIFEADQALDIRTKLSAMRTLAAIQGLTFQDAEKSSRELQILLAQQRPRDERLARITYAAP